MPLDQLAEEVRKASPVKVADLVKQDLDVRRLVQARGALEERQEQLRQEEEQALAKVHFLSQGIEKYEGRGWFGRWWHRKELAKLRAELVQRKAEVKAEVWALTKAQKALAKEHQATLKLEQQAQAKALAGAELEHARQTERHITLKTVYERRLERERPQQKQQEREQERGGMER